ncbi:hypothetical protein DV515_00014443, partial [Chloebia gouldiae]
MLCVNTCVCDVNTVCVCEQLCAQVGHCVGVNTVCVCVNTSLCECEHCVSVNTCVRDVNTVCVCEHCVNTCVRMSGCEHCVCECDSLHVCECEHCVSVNTVCVSEYEHCVCEHLCVSEWVSALCVCVNTCVCVSGCEHSVCVSVSTVCDGCEHCVSVSTVSVCEHLCVCVSTVYEHLCVCAARAREVEVCVCIDTGVCECVCGTGAGLTQVCVARVCAGVFAHLTSEGSCVRASSVGTCVCSGAGCGDTGVTAGRAELGCGCEEWGSLTHRGAAAGRVAPAGILAAAGISVIVGVRVSWGHGGHGCLDVLGGPAVPVFLVFPMFSVFLMFSAVPVFSVFPMFPVVPVFPRVAAGALEGRTPLSGRSKSSEMPKIPVNPGRHPLNGGPGLSAHGPSHSALEPSLKPFGRADASIKASKPWKSRERLEFLGAATGHSEMLRACPVPRNSAPAESIPSWHHTLTAGVVADFHPSKFSCGFGEVSRILGQSVSCLFPFCPGTRMGRKSDRDVPLHLLTSWVSLKTLPRAELLNIRGWKRLKPSVGFVPVSFLVALWDSSGDKCSFPGGHPGLSEPDFSLSRQVPAGMQKGWDCREIRQGFPRAWGYLRTSGPPHIPAWLNDLQEDAFFPFFPLSSVLLPLLDAAATRSFPCPGQRLSKKPQFHFPSRKTPLEVFPVLSRVFLLCCLQHLPAPLHFQGSSDVLEKPPSPFPSLQPLELPETPGSILSLPQVLVSVPSSWDIFQDMETPAMKGFAVIPLEMRNFPSSQQVPAQDKPRGCRLKDRHCGG